MICYRQVSTSTNHSNKFGYLVFYILTEWRGRIKKTMVIEQKDVGVQKKKKES